MELITNISSRGKSVEFSLGPRSLITHINTLGAHDFITLCTTEIFNSEINLVHRDLSPKLEYFNNPSIKESWGSRTRNHGH